MGYDVSFEYLVDDAMGQARSTRKGPGYKSTGVHR
jgi:hypothetical protein